MTTRVTRLIAAIAVLVFVSAPVFAERPNLTGKWIMTVTGHGDISLDLVLKQEGVKITGSLTTPHGEILIEGKIDGELTLSGTADGAGSIFIAGKIKSDGTLEGKLSGPMGEMFWSAKRAV